MGQGLGVINIFSLVDILFPSLSSYISVIGPVSFLLIGLLSVFSNVLLEPGCEYENPSLEEITLELKDSGVIVRLVCFISHYIFININKLLKSKLYDVIYKTAKQCSKFMNIFKFEKTVYNIKPTELNKPFDHNVEIDNDIKKIMKDKSE